MGWPGFQLWPTWPTWPTTPVSPRRATLTQRCSCGASIEIDIAKTWDTTGAAMRWFATHPCPNRTEPITEEDR